MDYETVIRERFRETAQNYEKLTANAEQIQKVSLEIVARMRRGGCVYFCGNGGSAADAQHLAAELQGRFLHDRRPLSSIALTTNTSTLTAIGNDYGYAQIFDRQLRGLGQTEDVLVGLSTSGNSENIMLAMATAREMGIYAVGLTGSTGGAMADACDTCIRVPADHTARIQEMHIAVGHMMCEIVEQELM
ncbi:D-sedoheptulose 7-phosphate isomerase [Litoreibacter ponti]|uniref:Phosphoheptose isomerase n=1 Tax=Litoreibacter ponti TaxID=1510457 RepID=A0A2T6BNU3_9RHOB|nr:D-sedoheptulose 7-phosphate isomerase [Litoreibacter ponti]PTX57735.1 D-sedoheptulose 7-phosphate isomerase [Litoreibacter ponti]